MFNSYDFTFAGTPSSMYGMFICDSSSHKHSANRFGNKAKILDARPDNRITPIHYGVRYHDEPLSFILYFGTNHELDRYDLQEVSNWLTGYQDYQWLSIDQPDLEHVQFRCLVTELTPVHYMWLPMAFGAKIVCDCPYGYSYPFEEEMVVSGTTQYRFYNDSTIRENLRPELRIELAPGCRKFSITNQTTGSSIQFKELPSGGITILVDNENEILQDANGSYDLYEYFNFQFLEFASGDNQLVVDGDGRIVISGRYLYNVGA